MCNTVPCCCWIRSIFCAWCTNTHINTHRYTNTNAFAQSENESISINIKSTWNFTWHLIMNNNNKEDNNNKKYIYSRTLNVIQSSNEILTIFYHFYFEKYNNNTPRYRVLYAIFVRNCFFSRQHNEN